MLAKFRRSLVECYESAAQIRVPIAWLLWVIVGVAMGKAVVALTGPMPWPFGTDEVTYSQIANIIAGRPTELLQPDRYGQLLWVSGAMVVPAAALSVIGIDSAAALRIVSVSYSALASVLFVLLLARLQEPALDRGMGRRHLRGVALLSACIFILWPSRNVWSLAGLRESTAEFWLLASLSLSWGFLKARSNLLATCFGIGLVISIFAIGITRAEIAVTFVAAVTISGIWDTRNRKSLGLLGLVLAFCALTASVAVPRLWAPMMERQQVPSESQQSVQVAPLTQSSMDGLHAQRQETTPNSSETSLVEQHSGDVPSTSSGPTEAPVDNPSTPPTSWAEVLTVLDHFALASQGRESRRTEALSGFEIMECPLPISAGEGLLCEAQRLPAAMLTVLFRPLSPLDQATWPGISSTMIALENLGWLVLCVGATWGVVAKIRSPRGLPLLAMSFILSTSALLAAFEGNLGTAFRHKSIVLWAVCLLLAQTSVSTYLRMAATHPSVPSRGSACDL